MQRINAALDWLGEKVTRVVGTMWCALAFVVVAITATPGIFPQPVTAAAQWLAQDFLQLVLLSVIMVGDAVDAGRAEKRNIEMHDWLQEWHDEHAAQLAALHEKVDAVSGVDS